MVAKERAPDKYRCCLIRLVSAPTDYINIATSHLDTEVTPLDGIAVAAP